VHTKGHLVELVQWPVCQLVNVTDTIARPF